MASILGRPEEKSDYQEGTDDVERTQVAKRWTRAMIKYGVEARGRPNILLDQFQAQVLNVNRRLSQVFFPFRQNVERMYNTARYSSSGFP